MYSYMPNGVKERADCAGDAWALGHRCLGPTYNMQDIDALFGAVAFGQNTGEKLFLEYVPDNYSNRRKVIRNFGLVAMFDRKSTRAAALNPNNTLSTAVYLWMSRVIAEKQNVTPKFFYVCGEQVPPWVLVEIDIFSGEATGVEATIEETSDWRLIWQSIGLKQLREAVRELIDPRQAYV